MGAGTMSREVSDHELLHITALPVAVDQFLFALGDLLDPDPEQGAAQRALNGVLLQLDLLVPALKSARAAVDDIQARGAEDRQRARRPRSASAEFQRARNRRFAAMENEAGGFE